MVNAAIVPSNNGKHNNHTYMGEIFIKVGKNVIVITPHRIIINSNFTSWVDETPIQIGHLRLQTSNNGKMLQISIKNHIAISIRRNIRENVTNFLNIFIDNNRGLSKDSTGILGKHFKYIDI